MLKLKKILTYSWPLLVVGTLSYSCGPRAFLWDQEGIGQKTSIEKEMLPSDTTYQEKLILTNLKSIIDQYNTRPTNLTPFEETYVVLPYPELKDVRDNLNPRDTLDSKEIKNLVNKLFFEIKQKTEDSLLTKDN